MVVPHADASSSLTLLLEPAGLLRSALSQSLLRRHYEEALLAKASSQIAFYFYFAFPSNWILFAYLSLEVEVSEEGC